MGYIVCGWYTPDYAHCAARLRKSLDALGERHDIVAVDKAAGGWERNTMRKATQIKSAMIRHPGETIIFLDVDCVVLAPLAELAATTGDVALYMRARRVKAAVGLNARSGTMVIRPTAKAMTFVDAWEGLSAAAPRGTVDQHTLPEAIVRVPGLSVEQIDVRYCATIPEGISHPVILHDSESKKFRKIPKVARRFWAWVGERGVSALAARGA